MKHFEEVWEDAETEEQIPKEIIFSNIRKLLESYLDADRQQTDPQYLNSVHHSIMGEILINLSQLSKTDNINTYKALVEALQRLKIKKHSSK